MKSELPLSPSTLSPTLSKSRSVVSNQAAEHDNLSEVVTKHLSTEFKRPIAQHNIDAYQYAISQINKPHVIFDSGCGNGKSTLNLAEKYPDAFIIGIDKSHHRINKLAAETSATEHKKNYCHSKTDMPMLINYYNRLCPLLTHILQCCFLNSINKLQRLQ